MKRRSINYVALVLLPLWLVSLLIAVFSVPGALRAQEKTSLPVVFVSLSWNNQLPFRIALPRDFSKTRDFRSN